MGLESLPRLVFLAEEHRTPFPKDLENLIPHGSLINAIAKDGIMAACVNGSLPSDQVLKFYDNGRMSREETAGPTRGDSGEFRQLLGQVAVDTLELDRDQLKLDNYLSRMAEIRDFVVYGADELVGTADVSMGETSGSMEVPKYMTGFEPLDSLTGGFYQGIVTLMGKTGTGKTSLMLSLLEALRKNNVVSSSLFLEVEIPQSMMLWKTSPMRERTTFTDKDRLLTGAYSIRQVLRKLTEDPDPNRAVFIDGPDAMSAGTGDKKRFAIEGIYRDLVRIKNLCKLVVVSSQTRRGDETLDLESVAEAWTKAWYSDIVLGLHRQAPVMGAKNAHRMMVNCSKNRFGPVGGEVLFDFDYVGLSYRKVVGVSDGWDFENLKSPTIAEVFHDNKTTPNPDWE